ncbi:uncharacterized protein [Littorina saxatilis]|uniref:uncharacterized protein isoform X2 n=1 Tax=Littorina saxatilis TaxID=31220 RepID=UPI0038B6AF41
MDARDQLELAAWDEDDAEDDFVVFALLDQPERRAYEGQFALDHFTAIECEDLFRFSAEEIRRLCALLGMQRTMQAPNGMNNQGTKASGLEVLCICLRRLAYPCRFADLSQMFHRPKPELCVLFKFAGRGRGSSCLPIPRYQAATKQPSSPARQSHGTLHSSLKILFFNHNFFKDTELSNIWAVWICLRTRPYKRSNLLLLHSWAETPMYTHIFCLSVFLTCITIFTCHLGSLASLSVICWNVHLYLLLATHSSSIRGRGLKSVWFGSILTFDERFISRSQLCTDSLRCPNTPVCTHAHKKDPTFTAKVSGLVKHEDTNASSLVSDYHDCISIL